MQNVTNLYSRAFGLHQQLASESLLSSPECDGMLNYLACKAAPSKLFFSRRGGVPFTLHGRLSYVDAFPRGCSST